MKKGWVVCLLFFCAGLTVGLVLGVSGLVTYLVGN